MLKQKYADVIEMFSRQILVRDVGVKGLKRLLESRVVILGCGATGSTIAELLVRAGVGFIRIVDRDIVELSNLPRTHLFTNRDVEELRPKALACADHLREYLGINKIEPVISNIDSSNIERLIKDVDLIIDGSDNYELRYLINDAAIKHGKPWIYVGVEGWFGSVMFIKPYETACLRCIIPQPPPDVGDACDIIGVMNVTVSMTASVAASIALKYLMGVKIDPEYIFVDARDLSIHKFKIVRNPNCPACGFRRLEFLNKDAEHVKRICGSNSVQIIPRERMVISLNKMISSKYINEEFKILRSSDYVAIIKHKDHDIIIFVDGRAIITGLSDEKTAENIYKRLIETLYLSGLIETKDQRRSLDTSDHSDI